MFDRPRVTDASIVAAVNAAYDRRVQRLAFLGLGHDANAWTFRADLADGDRLFLKVRRTIDIARLAACRLMFDGGIKAIVAPLPTISGDLSIVVDGLHLVAYPYLEARPAAEAGLTEAQWIEYGAIVSRVHATRLPSEIERALPREAFAPRSLLGLDRLERTVGEADPDSASDPVRGDLIDLWRKHHDEIRAVADRTATLAERLRAWLEMDGRRTLVPCHGDFHTHNVLVEPAGRLRVADWDEIVMAPPERDLMFVLGSPIGLPRGEREIALFGEGYGRLDVDAERLAYYHADWAVQDLVGYAIESLNAEASAESRAAALDIFRGLFAPGDEVEVALGAGRSSR